MSIGSAEILVLLALLVFMAIGVAIVLLFTTSLKRQISTKNEDEAGSPLATRWQEAMEKTRAALAAANEENDFPRRLAALDSAIDSVRFIHSRATTDLQREAATALEETVRGAWRSAQGELHLTQARAALRRALGSTDNLAQQTAWDEFKRERDKAQSFGVSGVQLQVLENEVQAVAASLGTVIAPEAPSSETTSSSIQQSESA